MEKALIRSQKLLLRNQLDKKQVERLSSDIITNLVKKFFDRIDEFKDKKIAIYFAIKNEPVMMPICYLVKNPIYLPKIVGNKLYFGKYDGFSKNSLVKNSQYPDILEPKQYDELDWPDIIITPIVAFDDKKNRIGMGGGFYDRTIAFLKNLNKKVIFVGVAYDSLQVDKIISEEFDQKLDYIITQTQIL